MVAAAAAAAASPWRWGTRRCRSWRPPSPPAPAPHGAHGWSRNGTNHKVRAAAHANWTALKAEKYWAPDPDVLAVTPFLLVGKFWERKGWTFVECSSGDEASRAGAGGRVEGSQCAEPLEQWPIFSAWRDARL